MREIVRHEPGTFCWPELATTDTDSAKTLYGSLFGWAFDDQSAESGTSYTTARLAGRDVAALYALERSQRLRGVLAHWNSYAAVASADESTTRVKVLGGTIFGAPFDVGKNGPMAIVKDPQGATPGLWEALRLGAEKAGDGHAHLHRAVEGAAARGRDDGDREGSRAGRAGMGSVFPRGRLRRGRGEGADARSACLPETR